MWHFKRVFRSGKKWVENTSDFYYSQFLHLHFPWFFPSCRYTLLFLQFPKDTEIWNNLTNWIFLAGSTRIQAVMDCILLCFKASRSSLGQTRFWTWSYIFAQPAGHIFCKQMGWIWFWLLGPSTGYTSVSWSITYPSMELGTKRDREISMMNNVHFTGMLPMNTALG